RAALRLTAGHWPGRQPPRLSLASGGGALAAFVAPDQARTYQMLLPPDAGALVLRSTVEQPPGRDPRWLGVQLLGFEATASGWPTRAAMDALKIALAGISLALIAAWSVRRGVAAVAALTGLGLLLRVAQLTYVPPGFFQDEAVSLVDAWHLAQTGRDHLGHLLPLGALEAFGDWISPLFTYLAVSAVALFGPSLLAGRLLAATLGALAIPAGYGLARALRLPKVAALCVALVVAISPWQILRTRVATPPALVPLSWTLLLWAALLFVRRGGRREALWLALAAGLGIYSYPTMKLAVPLLAGLAIVLAFVRRVGRPTTDDRRPTTDDRRPTTDDQETFNSQLPTPDSQLPNAALRSIARDWLPGALLLALLWLPLAAVTLLNPDSAMRAQSKLLRADTPSAWLAQWAEGYASYFLPAFYYQTGDASNGMPGQGVQLPVEAPLVLLGLGVLLWRIYDVRFTIYDWDPVYRQSQIKNLKSKVEWWLLLGALLIAPLPASLMFPNPHLTRALIAAPGYALLAGLGIAVLLGRPTTNDQRPTTTAKWSIPIPHPLSPNCERWRSCWWLWRCCGRAGCVLAAT
ncbi:MAG TPA: glycosyltransferase family 39 protein, partial [Roseiflexaceae bacterium]|nr:glycosyltransferase family 39 protein [Roseiflexaceae bacterium]